jgi:hypothetical protein
VDGEADDAARSDGRADGAEAEAVEGGGGERAGGLRGSLFLFRGVGTDQGQQQEQARRHGGDLSFAGGFGLAL